MTPIAPRFTDAGPRAALRLAFACVPLAAFAACGNGDDSAVPAPTDAGTGGATISDGEASSDASVDGIASDGGNAARPPCSSLPGTIVYIESGDTQEALLKRMGRELRDAVGITLVFELTGSCTLTPNLYAGNPIAAGQVMQYIPSTTENPNWTTAQAESTCTITAATKPDLGISALYPASCQLGGPEAGSSIGLVDGPVQAYTFIVPPSQFAAVGDAIYAEEAHAAFGANKGAGRVSWSGVTEWNDPKQMFFRPTTKSTLVSTAFHIELTAAVMAQSAVQEPASSDVLSAVSAATSIDSIGILGDEVYDTQGRGKVNVLAFKAFGQNAAYFPDSTPTSFDKQNIRDGHYTMWSPTVYITAVDALNEPTNPAVKVLTDAVNGNAGATPPDGGAPIDGLADVAAVGLTPGCAMQVTRAMAEDGAPIIAAASVPACTCYFLSKIPGASGTPDHCTTCGDGGGCAAGQACIRGFCEGAGAGVPAYSGDGGGCDTTTTVGPNACTNATPVTKAAITIADADP